MNIPIEISARHIHLSQHDLDILFGVNYCLAKEKDLSQTGQFATKETLTLKGSKGKIDCVRIIAPVRPQTQVEISITDSYCLGIKIEQPTLSGDLQTSSGGIEIIGPVGKVIMEKGVIVAQRHLHIDLETAQKLNLKNGQNICIETIGKRSVVFKNVAVRIKESATLSFQVDTDEANAAGLNNGDFGKIV